MIKKFKIFELIDQEEEIKYLAEDIYDCGFYLEDNISSKNRFFNWEYIEPNFDEYPDEPILYEFYYDLDTEEEILDKIYNFLDDENLKFEQGTGTHTLADRYTPKQIKIDIYVPRDKVSEYAEFHREMTKYNL